MDDLISRQAFKEECLKAGFFPAQIAAALKRTPAVDAAEVVRCKECEYHEADECVNPYIFMSDGAHLYTEENDFCSYGERKENES